LAKQIAAHKLGAKKGHEGMSKSLVKTADKLGLVDSQGRPAWQAVQNAGGAQAFVGASAEKVAALVAKGAQKKAAQMDAMNAAHLVSRSAAVQAETARFTAILTAAGSMDPTAAGAWLANPISSLSRDAGNDLIHHVKSEAGRRMAQEQLGRLISEKEWQKMKLAPDGQEIMKEVNSGKLKVTRAAQRDKHIQEILSSWSLGRAKDYMAATIHIRIQSELRSSRRRARGGGAGGKDDASEEALRG